MRAPPLRPVETAEPEQERKLRPEDVGLTEDEYRSAVVRLGRAPTDVELGMLGALWSEHCAYKHSRHLLARLPTGSAAVLVGPGENAGAVDLGGGLACVFKVESHNHPSAVEPFQGAATGVGGIVRDVFTMGARPIALLNALFFGDPSRSRTRYLYGGVVGGIAFYGNCLGIPDVGGLVAFHESYDENPLVNAMCVGLVPSARLTRATGAAVGDAVYLVGADTGRDGIAGASLLASFELGEEGGDAKRPSVQVGDPFLEKLVMEACLELVEGDHVAAMQDLGAAGLACAASEVAAKARSGIELDVRAMPQRARGMTSYEVMLSESQERMLVVPRRGHEGDLERLCARWGVPATRVGRVVAEDIVRVRDGDALAAQIPASLLVGGAPTYDRAAAPVTAAPSRPAASRDAKARLLALLADPNVASRERVYRRYDQMVGIDTVIGPGGDAAVLRLRHRTDGIALTIDCAPPALCARDPELAAAASVAEAARNLVCVGARPLALTDCINLGNPERPGGAWQLRRVIDGLARAAEALGLPFVSGNVSLYNGRVSAAGGSGADADARTSQRARSDPGRVSAAGGRDIVPAPVVGAVGHLADVSGALRPGIGRDGDALVLLGQRELDLSREAALHATVLRLHADGLLSAAHDLGTGGLAVAVAEMAIRCGTGARLHEDDLFSDGPGGRVVVATPQPAKVMAAAERAGVPSIVVGEVGGEALVLDGTLLRLADCAAAYRGGLAAALGLDS